MSNTHGGDHDEKGIQSNNNYTPLKDASGIPVATYIPEAVRVQAPSDLPEGYQFTVLANNLRLMVAVPDGGVQEGQYFHAKVMGTDSSIPSQSDTIDIPFGRWRDGLCDCCELGLCHPVQWMACCCYPIALGQVMTRFDLNWWGSSMTKHPSSYPAFVVLFVSFLMFLVLDKTLGMLAPSLTVHYEYTSSYSDYGSTSYASSPGLTGTASLVVFAFQSAIRLAYFLFLLMLTIRLRSRVRAQYAIPEQTCTGCEDCCCAYWCHCCVVAQMARHVNDYEHQPAACCSDTGLQKEVPHIV